MNRTKLDSFVSIPVSVELYDELSRRFAGGVSSVLEQITWDFLERTTEDFSVSHTPVKGHQWDALLLPNGTQVRTKYFEDVKVAEIRDSKIFWEGKKFRSMSQLARSMRGNTSNNAWKVLEVLRPSDKQWVLADYLRNT